MVGGPWEIGSGIELVFALGVTPGSETFRHFAPWVTSEVVRIGVLRPPSSEIVGSRGCAMSWHLEFKKTREKTSTEMWTKRKK